MTIGWQSGMETGAPLLDAQHRSLVERAAALVATIERGSERRSWSGLCATSATTPSATSRWTRTAPCAEAAGARVNGIARAELIRILAGFRQSYESGERRPIWREPFLPAFRLGGRYIPPATWFDPAL